MFNLLLEATPEAGAGLGNQWWIYLILIGMVIVMLVVPSISNRKRAKEYNDMVNAIGVGDTVRTVGGIIGRIVKVSEKDGYKTFILETGAKNSKTTMEFDIASIYTVLNSKNKPAAVAEPKEELKAEEVKAEEPKTEEKSAETEQSKPEETAEEAKVEEKKPAKKTSKKASK